MKKVYRRGWLNKEGTAFFELSSHPSERYRDVSLRLADCSRSICLDLGFDPANPKDRTRALQKIAKLREILDFATTYIESENGRKRRQPKTR